MGAESVSRTSRLAANTVFSAAAWFLPIVIGFFTTPILVKNLGNENYGLYAVITGFAAYSFSFGLGKIAAKYVAEYGASGETEKLKPIISATLAFTIAVALSGTIIVAAFARTIVTDILLIDASRVDVAVISFYFACAMVSAAMISQVFQFILQGLHRFGAFLILTNVNAALIGAGSIAIVLNGGGVAALIIWNMVATSVSALVYYAAARRALPAGAFSFRFEREAVRAVLAYGGSIIFYQAFGNILYIFERSWVTRKFGAEALAFYAVPMMLAIYLHSFVSSFAVVLFPTINELLHDRKRQIELYQKASKVILAFVVLAVTTFICIGKIGLLIWINQDFAENSYALLVIHGITFGLIAIQIIAWQLAEGYGRARINALVSAAWLVTAVPLMVLAADVLGSVGVAASRLFAVAATLPVIAYCERRFLGRVFFNFWAGSIVRAAPAAFAAAFTEITIAFILPAGWPMLAAASLAGLAVFVLILYATGYFTADERRLLSSLIAARLTTVQKSASTK